MLTVICINGLLAVGIGFLTVLLWRWRTRLMCLTMSLQQAEYRMALEPKEMGYALAVRRSQLLETRLWVARWQVRSRQVRQILQLIGLLRMLLLYQRRLSSAGLALGQGAQARARYSHK